MTLKASVTFVGLGSMGRGMAVHLLKSGYEVIGYDNYRPSLDRFEAEGGRVVSSPQEAARQSQCFICMVANSAQASMLLFDGEKGAVSTMPKGACLLMCSTVDPAYIQEVKGTLSEWGRADIHLIDCPVSGGPGRAANGTLSIFSSGDDVDLAQVNDVLGCLSQKLYKVPGGIGGGSKAKLIHQIFAGVNIAMASEAMGLAACAGLDSQGVFEEIKASDASSWMFENRVPFMLDADAPPYSAMSIITKDVGIITKTGRAFQFPLPMVSCAEQLYLMAISQGLEAENDCTLIRLYLSSHTNLTGQQAPRYQETRRSSIEASDIADLMVGVHIAALAEAMSFSDALGVDTNLMHDIVTHAAGASNILPKVFNDLQQNEWSLSGLPTFSAVISGLTNAIEKAYLLRYPLFLSTAALQEFFRQKQKS